MKKVKKVLLLMVAMVLFLSLSMTSIASVKISKKSITLRKGQAFFLEINGTNKNVKWASNKKSVATVSKTGKIIAKKKGTATIMARIGRKKYTCKVTVREKLSAKQAEEAVTNFLLRKKFDFFSSPASKYGKYYVVWIHYRKGMCSKYVVNSITGATRSYAPYILVDIPAGNEVWLEYKFNAYKYLK